MSQKPRVPNDPVGYSASDSATCFAPALQLKRSKCQQSPVFPSGQFASCPPQFNTSTTSNDGSSDAKTERNASIRSASFSRSAHDGPRHSMNVFDHCITSRTDPAHSPYGRNPQQPASCQQVDLQMSPCKGESWWRSLLPSPSHPRDLGVQNTGNDA